MRSLLDRGLGCLHALFVSSFLLFFFLHNISNTMSYIMKASSPGLSRGVLEIWGASNSSSQGGCLHLSAEYNLVPHRVATKLQWLWCLWRASTGPADRGSHVSSSCCRNILNTANCQQLPALESLSGATAMSCACKGKGAFSRHAEQPLELFWTSKATGCSCSVAQSDPKGPPTSGDGKTSPPLIFGQTLLGKFQKGKPRMRTVCLRQHTNLVCILYSTYFHNLLPPHFSPWPCTHAPLDKVTDRWASTLSTLQNHWMFPLWKHTLNGNYSSPGALEKAVADTHPELYPSAILFHIHEELSR